MAKISVIFNNIKKLFSIRYEQIINDNFYQRKIISILGIKVRLKVKITNAPVLCLIGAGGIGDYTFYCSYFKYIKQSPIYKNYKIIFIAKKEYYDFVKLYNNEDFDLIIPYSREIETNILYKKYLLKSINKYKIETLVNLHTLLNSGHDDLRARDILAKNIKAKHKYIHVVKTKFHNNPSKDLKKYDKIIMVEEDKLLFENDNRKEFFEKFLKMELPSKLVEFKPIIEFGKKKIGISLCTSDPLRQFPEDKCIKMLNYLLSKIDSNYNLIFLGSESEKQWIDGVISNLNSTDVCINLAGKLQSSFIPTILSDCEFLLSVESGNVHLAHSVGIPFICLSNGSYYNRFQPYRDKKSYYIYPPKYKEYISNPDNDLVKLYNPHINFEMADIEILDVYNKIDELVSKIGDNNA